MLPWKNPRPSVNAPPPPLPPQYDIVAIRAEIASAVAVAIAQVNHQGTSGSGSGIVTPNHGEGQGRSRECSYKDFTNGKPKPFNGSGGVITLMHWFEMNESIFEICACPEASKVKFAGCTFSNRALTWCNGHVQTLTLRVANLLKLGELEGYDGEGILPQGGNAKVGAGTLES